MKTGLVWFKNDLRIHDNEALTKAAQECDELIFCYAIEKSLFNKLELGFRKCDINRFKFLEQSVVDLQKHLDKLGGHLLIGSDSAAQLLPELVEKYDISDIYAEEEYASEELNLLEEIQKKNFRSKISFLLGKNAVS